MQQMTLAGMWTRCIGGKALDRVPVPGSCELVGEYTLEREFGLPSFAEATEGGRFFLCTEGVLSNAEFTLNGTSVGTVGPWVPYRIELPAGLLRDTNRIQARIRDCLDTFGPPPGRKMDGGLFRAVCLERRPACFIESVRFSAKVAPDGGSAACTVEVALNGTGVEQVEVTLRERDGGRLVASGVWAACPHAAGSRDEDIPPTTGPIAFGVERPCLWSPESPFLYTLSVRTLGGDPDEVEEMIGFRTLEIRGQDFWLNGRRLFLKGVCRHEFMSGYGHSPPESEVRLELARIKHAGFNYVRLVHSPQAACVPRIAAELGLLVTEETGVCHHNLDDPQVVAPALDALTRIVLRDRNLPSILAWLVYNECNPSVSYAVAAAGRCRELHPDGLVSVADCSGRHDDVKKMMEAARLDYIGLNLYSINVRDYQSRMEAFAACPLVITEWGACLVIDNARWMDFLWRMFVRFSRPAEPLHLAGCSFWAWADYEEYTRAEPAALAGWTTEGLVDKQRRPKPELALLSQMCFEIDHQPPLPPPAIEILVKTPTRPGRWHCVPLDDLAGGQGELEEELRRLRQSYEHRLPVFGEIQVAGIPFACRDRGALAFPLLLGKGREEVYIPVGRKVSHVAVLGHVTMKCGYPFNNLWSVHHGSGEPGKSYGDPAFTYAFDFEEGVVVEELLHGRDVLRSNNILRWWKTAPRSATTVPAVQATVHPSYEILRLDLWEKSFPEPAFLQGIRWQAQDVDSIHLLHAITVLECGGQ